MNRDGIPLPSALSGELSERTISIDSSLVYLIAGALTELADDWWLEQTDTLTVEDAKLALSEMLDCYLRGEDCAVKYPEFFTVNLLAAESVNGAGFATTISSTYANNYFIGFSPPALNDEFKVRFFARKGTYTLTVIGNTGANFGQCEVREAGTPISGSFDWYSAGSANNVKKNGGAVC